MYKISDKQVSLMKEMERNKSLNRRVFRKNWRRQDCLGMICGALCQVFARSFEKEIFNEKELLRLTC